MILEKKVSLFFNIPNSIVKVYFYLFNCISVVADCNNYNAVAVAVAIIWYCNAEYHHSCYFFLSYTNAISSFSFT